MSSQLGQHHPRVANLWGGPDLSRSDPPETQVRAACQKVLRAHEVVAGFAQSDNESITAIQNGEVASAQQRRADAFRDLHRCRPEGVADVRAMLNVLSVLEEWFGDQDLATTGFALHITHVIGPFLAPPDTRLERLNEKAVPQRVSSPWFGRFPKLF